MVTMFPPVLQLQPVHKPHTLTDFTDFERVVGDERTNLSVGKIQGH
jgi:hypothetical protein